MKVFFTALFCVYDHHSCKITVIGCRDWRLVCANQGRGFTQYVFMHHATTSAVVCKLQLVVMSLNTVGTTICRTLWTTGNRTPPFVRSPKVNRLSASRLASTDRKQGRATKDESYGSCNERPGSDVPTSSDPAPRCKSGDKRQTKEHMGATGVSGVRRRSYTSTAVPVDQKSYLWTRYGEMKRLVHGKQTTSPDIPPPPNHGYA